MGSSVPPIEIGSLTAVSPSESQFIGSSSGIFFVNTVRRAFAVSNAKSPGEQTQTEEGAHAETYIGGVDVDEPENDTSGTQTPRHPAANTQPRSFIIDTRLLGQRPTEEHASKLIQVYFRVWHPLFPFLHGPSFLEEVEKTYTEGYDISPAKDKSERRQRYCRSITLQCIFNIAALDRPDLRLSTNCSIKSTNGLVTQLCSLGTRHDIQVLQALLAGQIYLVATMSLHAASTIGGVLLRLILHGGLHRCPFRYSQISPQDAETRKRIFWSAYAIDRYLSQALGLPLGVQDSDIDVCTPGVELHHPVQSQAPTGEHGMTDVALHLPDGHPALPSHRSEGSVTSADRTVVSGLVSDLSQQTIRSVSKERHPREDALTHYIAYGRLTGRALEMLHKSINVRTVKYNDILELTSDIHSFWNSLPQQLQDLPDPNLLSHGNTDQSVLGLFFTLIYQQLILLVNRPFLSLEPSSVEFRLSLQTCIGSSRTVISTMRDQASGHQCVSWPGALSVTWMSGLILAFACALDLYPVKKGFPEIKSCLQVLKGMSTSSTTAKYFHSALSVLLDDLSSSHYGENLGTVAGSQCNSNKRTHSSHIPNTSHGSSHQNNTGSSVPKRQRYDDRRNQAPLTEANIDGNRVESNLDQNRFSSSSGLSSYMATASLVNNHGAGANAPTQAWVEQFGTSLNNGDHIAAYSQDIFAGLSCENLLQYDEGFEAEFWNI